MNDLILVVEDNKTIAMYQKRVLETAGMSVIVAHNKVELDELLRLHNKKIMLAVVDINLPECEDCVLNHLLKLNMPCIAMTGSFHAKLRDKVINKKLIDYIVLEDDQNLELLKSTILRIINNKETKILIVDDSRASRFALKDLLEQQNYTVLEAADGIEALRCLRENDNIKVALVDYEMPHMNGAELTRLIRKEYSRTDMSILAISVHTEPIITIELLKAGANDFITKPYIKEEVIARISVNIDMIDQNRMLQKEIERRKIIEKQLETNNESLTIVLDESLEHKQNLIKTNRQLKKSQEQARVANLAKSSFLANMSHEIRTPLNAILGFIDILFKEESSEAKREKLKIIKKSGNSLLTIINDILDFSKIESGKFAIDKVHFKAREPFELITNLFYEKAEEKYIKLQLNIDDTLPENAYGDDTRIKQIYSNLLSNAIKFSYENTLIEMDVKYDEKSNFLTCSVKDSGIGIASEKLSTIFHAFEQEDSSITRKYGGTGLGLSISKTLAEMMGGDLSVESSLGKGSTFSFFLDVFSEVDENLIFEYDDTTHSDNDVKLSGKILVVEDNKTNQLLMEILLTELGLEVVIANDGLEAIEMFDKDDFALILMDENMPNMNGIEATQEIRRREENTKKQIPIVAVTANAFKSDRDRFLSVGMNDYISKPIDQDKLEKVLVNFLA